MDLFGSMKMYVAVVDGGSFAAAADKLEMSRAMASKQIQKLEEHLGTRLLNRTTRRLSLTETGRAFYERSLQIIGDVEEAEQIAGQMTRRPQGVLRVTLPLSYGQHRLAAIIGDYTQAYPQVQLDISLSDRKIDLVEDGLDLAIRIGALPQSDLIARKIGGVHSVVCAAPAYIARHGAIIRLAALSGAGILFQPQFIVDDDLAAGRLVRLLPQWQSAELGVYAVYPSRKHLSAKVRTFVDFLASALAGNA